MNNIIRLQNNSPSGVIFALDLHGVLLFPRIGTIFTILFMGLFSKSFFSYVYLLCNIPFWYHLYFEGALSEELVIHLMRKTGFTKNFFVQLIDHQEVNARLISLFQKFKKQGYRIVIASNIWRELLIDVEHKFPELDAFIDYYYIPDMDNYIEKPSKSFFYHFKTYLQLKNIQYEHIIFIDDQKNNVIGAYKEASFVAIQYKGYKSLVVELKQYGFADVITTKN